MTPSAWTLNSIDGVFPQAIASVQQLLSLGISSSTIAHRCTVKKMWQRLLPGVVALQPGPVTRDQSRTAALRYGGEQAVLTGADGLALHGIAVPQPAAVTIVVPHRVQVRSTATVHVRRALDVPKPLQIKGFRVAPVDRCLVDAAKDAAPGQVPGLVRAALLSGQSTMAGIWQEIELNGARDTAALRASVNDAAQAHLAWVRRVADGLFTAAKLPAPQWHCGPREQAYFPMVASTEQPQLALVVLSERATGAATSSTVNALTGAGYRVYCTSAAQLRAPDHRELIATLGN
jgi:hypothetical protein